MARAGHPAGRTTGALTARSPGPLPIQGAVPRFLCDRMLIRLARWLRAAGYDAAIAAEGCSDRDNLARALAERRLLVSRDRKLMEFRGAPGTVVLLSAGRVPHSAAESTARLALDWRHKPFSRCLVCNLELECAEAGLLARVPPASRAAAGTLRSCPGCDRVYWAGGHVRRMDARLARWAAGDFR